jgi:hypothetical protein
MAFYSCSTAPEENDNTAEVEAIPAEEIVEKTLTTNPAVCIWDKVSVREAAGEKAKWLTSLSIGESLTYMNIDSLVNNKTYSKILLNDAKQGWARKEFLVIDAKPAVVLGDIALYSRPDLLTKTDKKFSMMDIISSIEKHDDWMNVKGKRSEGKWIEDGWVKAQHISFEAVDIAAAKFAKEALAMTDQEAKINAIHEIINNPDLSSSKFISDLEILIKELSATEELSEIIEEGINQEQVSDSII